MENTPGVWRVQTQDAFQRWRSSYYVSEDDARKHFDGYVQALYDHNVVGEGDDIDDLAHLEFIPMPTTLEEFERVMNECGCHQ